MSLNKTESKENFKNSDDSLDNHESESFKGQDEDESIKENNYDEENESVKESDNDSENKEINFLEDQLKRTLADFSNYKKRIERDIDQMILLENSKIINEFLVFKEILEKAINHESQESSKKNLIELNNNFEIILKRLNIKKIDLLNKKYDYNFSECIQTINVSQKEEDNLVLEVIENAYSYKEKLIKPGKVIIGKFMEE